MDHLDREEMMLWLSQQGGCHVVGTTEEFDGEEDGIWIAADSTPKLFQYYSQGKPGFEAGVEKKLHTQTGQRGWYFQFNDPGTVMVWKIN